MYASTCNSEESPADHNAYSKVSKVPFKNKRCLHFSQSKAGLYQILSYIVLVPIYLVMMMINNNNDNASPLSILPAMHARYNQLLLMYLPIERPSI
jgi:hypothetical protein